MAVALDRRAEFVHVEPELLRHIVVERRAELVLPLEQLVVELPELALLVRGQGRLGGGHGVLMEGERLVLPGEADLALVLVADLLERRLDTPAEGALEVGPLDDGHRRAARAEHRGAADLDLRCHLLLRLSCGPDVLRRQYLVQLLGLDALLQSSVRLGDLLVDHRLERLERQGSGEEAAVDEEGGRSIGAHLRAVARVGGDRGGELRRLLVAAPAIHVEADLLGPFLVLRLGQLLLVLEHQLVHLPEFALLVGRQRGLGGGHGVLVEGQRLVAPDDLHVAFVCLEDLPHRRLGLEAERALEVGELDDGHLGVLRAHPGRVGAQLDVVRLRGGRRLLLRRRSRRTGLPVLH